MDGIRIERSRSERFRRDEHFVCFATVICFGLVFASFVAFQQHFLPVGVGNRDGILKRLREFWCVFYIVAFHFLQILVVIVR